MSIKVHASGVNKPADLPPAPVTRALLSVFDKTGVLEFARGLHALGVEILSTGGTAKLLADNGVPVIEVSDYTGFRNARRPRQDTAPEGARWPAGPA